MFDLQRGASVRIVQQPPMPHQSLLVSSNTAAGGNSGHSVVVLQQNPQQHPVLASNSLYLPRRVLMP